MKPVIHWKCIHSFEHPNFVTNPKEERKIPTTLKMMYHEKEHKFVVFHSCTKGVSVLQLRQKCGIGNGKQWICEYDTRLLNSGYGCSVALNGEKSEDLWCFGGYFFDEENEVDAINHHRCHMSMHEFYEQKLISSLAAASSKMRKTTMKATKRLTRVLSSNSSTLNSGSSDSEKTMSLSASLLAEAPKKTSHLFSYNLEKHCFSDNGNTDNIDYLTPGTTQAKPKVSPRIQLIANESSFWPKPHSGHHAIIQNHKMYIFGGPCEEKRLDVNDKGEMNEKALIKLGLASDLYAANSFVYIYDMHTKSWTQPTRTSFRSEKTLRIEYEKKGRMGMSDPAIVVEKPKSPPNKKKKEDNGINSLLSFRGTRATKSSSDLKSEFMYEASMPKNRIGHSVVLSGDVVHIWGGRILGNPDEDAYLCCDPCLYRYNLVTDDWCNLGPGEGDVPATRMNHAFATLPRRSQAFVILGGERIGASDHTSSTTKSTQEEEHTDWEIDDVTHVDTDSENDEDSSCPMPCIVDYYSDMFIYNIAVNSWTEVQQTGHCPLANNVKSDIAMSHDGKDLYLVLYNRSDSSLDFYRGVITYQ